MTEMTGHVRRNTHNLKALDGLNVDTMQPADVAQWSKWVNSVDASFDRAEAAIRSGRELLTAQNLRPFEQILKEPGDVKRFDAFLKGLGWADAAPQAPLMAFSHIRQSGPSFPAAAVTRPQGRDHPCLEPCLS